MKISKKALTAILCLVMAVACLSSLAVSAREVQAAAATIYSLVKSSKSTSKGCTSYILTVPVRVTAAHAKVTVQMSSARNFHCDDVTKTVVSPSTSKIRVNMGRWCAGSAAGKNRLYCRVGYYTKAGRWSGWVASCALYY